MRAQEDWAEVVKSCIAKDSVPMRKLARVGTEIPFYKRRPCSSRRRGLQPE